MDNDKNLLFIKSKIHDAGQAMIYRYIDENHKQALAIKTSIEVEENGQMFFLLRNEFEQKFCEDIFPVEVFFYKKGKPFYVTAKGIAKKWKNNASAFNNIETCSTVSIKMNQVEYYELNNPQESGWKKLLKGITTIQAVF